MSKPKSITVMGRKIKIIYKPLNDLYGHYSHDEQAIYINEFITGKELSDTLLHEKLHAILAISGLTHLLNENLEEAIVRAIEHGLT